MAIEYLDTPTNGKFEYLDEEEKTIPGFIKNVAGDVVDIGKGMHGLGKSVVDLGNRARTHAMEAGMKVGMGKPFAESNEPLVSDIKEAGNMALGIPKGLLHEAKRIGVGTLFKEGPLPAAKQFGEAFYEKPVTTALDVLPIASKAYSLSKGVRGLSRAAEAGAPLPSGGTPGAAEAVAKVAPTLGETIGQRIISKTTSGALNLNPGSVQRWAKKAGISSEEAVLRLGEKVDRLLPDLVKATDSANTKFDKVLNAHDASGKSLGSMVKKTTLESGGIVPESQKTINSLKEAASNYDQLDGGELALQKAATRLEKFQTEGKLDFDRLSKYKSEIGKGFGKAETPAGTSEVYGILSDGIDDVINRVSIENPALAKDFALHKEIYNVTSNLLPAMAKTSAKEVAGASLGGGLMSKTIPAAIGSIVGGVPGAIIGTGAKFLQEAIAPDLLKNLGYIGMKKAQRFGQPLSRIGEMAPNPYWAGAAAAGNVGLQQNQQDELEKYLSRKYDQGGVR